MRASAATALGAALVIALAALDAHWGATRVISATVVIGPFLTALFAGPRATAAVAALAVASTILSGSYNDNFGTDAYFVSLAAVLAGGAFSVINPIARASLAADRKRFELIRGAALIADSQLGIAEVIERLQSLLVPAFARTCTIELGAAAAIEFSETAIVVPLRARGREIGTMRITGAHYTAADHEFAQLMAGRAALALENAGLEARFTAALDALAEAVTIQDDRGRLVYANEAAAQALGFESANVLLATPPQEIVDHYVSYLENGMPLTLDVLPGRHVLQGRTPEPLTIRSIRRDTGEERWRIVKASAVEGNSRLVVNVIEDVTEVKRAEVSERFLAQAGSVLSSSLDYEQTLARIAQLAVPRLADWCSVGLPDGERMRSVAVAHVDPAKIAFAKRYEERYPTTLDEPGGAAQVLREGTSAFANDITDELLRATITDRDQLAAVRSLGMRAVMLVPIVAGGHTIGVITLVSAESARNFTAADLQLAEELGRRAGTAVQNARLYRERSHIAATLQRGLLPDALPRIPGMRLSSLYRPAGEENLVGGDFYDAFRTPSGWMLVVGDVTGRGAGAAAQTGQARHTLRTAGRLLGDPQQALAQLNQTLTERRELTPCTVALVHVIGQTAQVLCAGHPQPLLVRGGEPRAVGHFGPMLGAWPDSAWRPEQLDLQPGDVLVLYTDGVTDTVGAGARFGDARLLEALRDVEDAPGAVAAIDRALNAFQVGAQADDTAVLALDLPLGAA